MSLDSRAINSDQERLPELPFAIGNDIPTAPPHPVPRLRELPFETWSIDDNIPTAPPLPSPTLFMPLAADGMRLPFTTWSIDDNIPTAPPLPSPTPFMPLVAADGMQLPFKTWSIDDNIPTAPPLSLPTSFMQLPFKTWSIDDNTPTAPLLPSPTSFMPLAAANNMQLPFATAPLWPQLKGSKPVNRGLCLLSIDGGGIRGLSALLILEELLHRLKIRHNLERAPLPCELFHLAGGKSTGGLIAIMLFRLRMSIGDAIDAYTNFAKTVFTEKKLPHKEGTFKATLLESAIVKIIQRTQGVDEIEAGRMRILDEEGPKCFVCALPTHNIGFPTCFRSWTSETNASYNCSIVEAARATSAAAPFFKGITIGKETYGDALGLNNPVKRVVSEAESAFPNCKISCLLSLGTGGPEIIGSDSKLIQVLKGIATNCEAVSKDVARDLHGKGIYFRLNVDAGLPLVEWTNLGTVREHTIAYLQKAEVDSEVDRLLVILDKQLTEL